MLQQRFLINSSQPTSSSDTGWIPATSIVAGSYTGNANGLLALDNDYSTIALPSFTSTSVAYKADGLAALLADAVAINGVEIRATGYRTAGTPVTNQIGPSNGTPLNGATTLNFTTTSSTYTYGGSNNLLGYDSASLLTMLKNTNSGIEISVWSPFGSTMTFYIDYLEIRVYYS